MTPSNPANWREDSEEEREREKYRGKIIRGCRLEEREVEDGKRRSKENPKGSNKAVEKATYLDDIYCMDNFSSTR